MASRKIEDLTPKMQNFYLLFKQRMDESGLPFIITCTARNIKEQIALYAQGRNEISFVNILRARVKLSPISDLENKRKVTWTLNSKHITDPEKGIVQSKAFDIALLYPDKKMVHWDLKADVDNNDVPDYFQAGEIGELVGLKWGGRFKSPDYVHFEEKED